MDTKIFLKLGLMFCLAVCIGLSAILFGAIAEFTFESIGDPDVPWHIWFLAIYVALILVIIIFYGKGEKKRTALSLALMIAFYSTFLMFTPKYASLAASFDGQHPGAVQIPLLFFTVLFIGSLAATKMVTDPSEETGKK